MSGTTFSRIDVIPVVVVFMVLLAASGCSSGPEDAAVPTPTPAYRVTLDTDRVFLNDVVRFSLVNVETGEIAADRYWSITSPHNVPGDRGVMRSDGLYTAPRIAPSPQMVEVRTRFEKIDYFSEFYVLDPRFPDPHATAMPGGSHTIFNDLDLRTTIPLGNGVAVGESFAITVADGTGTPLTIDHYEISQNNVVVENAGSITKDGIYTAPIVVPDPPTLTIKVHYFREGSEPGSLSAIGTQRFEIIP